MSLRAPIAVPVEIRAPAGRVFRLAAAIGEDGVRLQRGSSFEPGRPVNVRFALPGPASGGDGELLVLRAVIAPGDAEDDTLEFIDPPRDSRLAIRHYVHERLGLPT